MGKTFRSIHLCHTNDFDQKKSESIKKWVEAHGGTFHKTLAPEVTHLVCSKLAWNRYEPIVKEARRRHVKVVNFDWLEDSLLSSSRKPKNTRSYEWDRRDKQDKKKAFDRKAEKGKKIAEGIKNFAKQCSEFEMDTGETGYHLYTDATHFSYSITLVRPDILTNRLERHHLKVRYSAHFQSNPPACPAPLYYFPKPDPLSTSPATPTVRQNKHKLSNPRLRVPLMNPWAEMLQLWESDAIPHTYCVYTKFSTLGKAGKAVVAPVGSTWEAAFFAFRKFFQYKTGKKWEERLDRNIVPSNHLSKQDGSSEEVQREYFRYEPPKEGKAHGLVQEKTTLEKTRDSHETSVTVVVPTIEISDSEDRDAQVRTPDGGW